MATPCSGCAGSSFSAWKGTFCGLARCLGREYGNAARLLVNRDAAFIGLVGISLDPQVTRWKTATCCNPLATPFPVTDDHPAILHAAAVSVCGLGAKLADDAQDEGFLRRNVAKFGRFLTTPAIDSAVASLNSSAFPTAQVLHALGQQEQIECHDPLQADQPVARAYGTITAHLADLLDLPAHRPALHGLGAALGSLVYWRDAWQDRVADQARGRFNPFATQDHEVIRGRIATAWRDFGAAIGALPFVRHGALIDQIQSSTGQARRAFLQLHNGQETEAESEQKRRREQKERDGSCYRKCDNANCCDCCDCCTCLRGSKGGCCDAACDWGPGDTGCCDCNPCDGCDCCPCS